MKLFIFSALLLVMSVFINNGYSLENTGAQSSLSLAGDIEKAVSISFDCRNTQLQLDTDLHQKIACVHITANSPAGYEVIWSSANNGVMQHTQNPLAQVAYRLSAVYQATSGGQAIESTTFDLSTPKTFGDENSEVTNTTNDIYFTSTKNMVQDLSNGNSSSAQMLSGTYEDTITARIQAL